MILLITNPLNSLVPVYDKVYKRMGIDAGRKIIGLTILDTIRSATFIGEYLGISPDFCSIPVVGGHAGTTIIPLLSQLQSGYISEIDVPGITKRRRGGDGEGGMWVGDPLNGLRSCIVHHVCATCNGWRSQRHRARVRPTELS